MEAAVGVAESASRRRSSSASATAVMSDAAAKCSPSASSQDAAAVLDAAAVPDAVRSSSPTADWLRVSMRRVRHFRLLDPHQPSAPPMDCEPVEDVRPSSAPMHRPRQVGRAALRRPHNSANSTPQHRPSHPGARHPHHSFVARGEPSAQLATAPPQLGHQ
ncbi:uncharacterized protein LOC120352474 [Nilaparvata lugens]|uniref:uncharacterized protein LOC120352474 n=1 Tax=Nilaparvata lugens TaxID=108931 RepID=UPI00193E5545|nr:uncharacterized protein LOC120352474 [Nilaparvata lugens]